MKSPWESKTILAAVMVGALAALNQWTGTVEDPTVLNYGLLAVAILQVVLRYVTDKPIA